MDNVTENIPLQSIFFVKLLSPVGKKTDMCNNPKRFGLESDKPADIC
jgi:hypothetical protein